MSDLRIALVAEGPTDYVILEAALKAFLGRDFVLTQLQPEATKPEMGSGWGGVLKWCNQVSKRHAGSVGQEPTLVGYDLLIIHLDVDVSTFQYGDCGAEVDQLANSLNWGVLPCVQPCPPVGDTCNALSTVVQSWLGQASIGEGSVLCFPAQSSGTWLAAANLDSGHALLINAECNINVESGLSQLPKKYKIKKTKRDYLLKASTLTANWSQVKSICSQAQVFEHEVLNAIALNVEFNGA